MKILTIIFLLYFVSTTIYGAIYLAKTDRYDKKEYSLFDVLGNILPCMMMFILLPISLTNKIKFKK